MCLDAAHVRGQGLMRSRGCPLQELHDIVGQCLRKDPADRPSCAQLLKHKFFKVRFVLSGSTLLASLDDELCRGIAHACASGAYATSCWF